MNSNNIISHNAYTKGEELMHALTHWIGTIFVSFGAGVLITIAALTGDPWKIVSVSIFSASMITLYVASTLYHAAISPVAKRRLKIFDHISIYILIAGTYTPFLLINLRGVFGWVMFGIVWALALGGTIMKLFFTGRFKILSLAIYLGMGWIAIFAIKPFIQNVPSLGMIFIVIGGLLYSGGVYFYIRKDKAFYHGIWHLFVLAGTMVHFFAVLFGCVLI
ncbi:Channel protein, hemolysin III family [Elusimicrobium minutum Pei191]|uniref:Channel protein, hemolysin III family n=1 Tax=Elusimicrobium minutum (strain Pei191) TaxID=445932 RepID=B2KB79_ELUMP|nr:hemolysin III family protein [Elusimicrobium minutum]ACC97901.1 Channel protein, hemolysin III family [Elusimicrobium minutum Pei191]